MPTVGDRTSASERAAEPRAWAFPESDREALTRVIASRRDIRRFRPDPLDEAVVDRLLEAAHMAPSVGHSQPWRFVVVTDAGTRARAAAMADGARLAQAARMDPEAGRQLLDLDLEGIREAPLGIVVCCDRRVPAEGVLGRATFVEADMWSCACAIQNLWLTARAEGLGVGWVTLFEPSELAALVGAPPGVETLGWLCVGWPDERPPGPGLERRGWSRRQKLEEVVIRESWPGSGAPTAPLSRVAAPGPKAVVDAHDSGDRILTPPGSLGVLDRAVDRFLALRTEADSERPWALIVAAADHPVVRHGVTAFRPEVTSVVAAATAAGASVGAVAARAAQLDLFLVDAGIDGDPPPGAVDARPLGRKGDLAGSDALSERDAVSLIEHGRRLALELVSGGYPLIALGEVGVGNTTVAAATAAALLGLDADAVAGLGSGSDSAIVAAKRQVITAAIGRLVERAPSAEPVGILAALGGGELAVLAGAVLGAAEGGAVIILDGLATTVPALIAARMEPGTISHLLAGQRSREVAHPPVLAALGLEPLLDLRLRAGEGVGASLAASILRNGLAVRIHSARTAAGGDQPRR